MKKMKMLKKIWTSSPPKTSMNSCVPGKYVTAYGFSVIQHTLFRKASVSILLPRRLYEGDDANWHMLTVSS